jgi:rod shape-determining protein MreC
MEFLLNRYRNLTVLLVAIVAQLVLLAYQVKSNGEVRLIRVWAVTAVTPLARAIETGRSATAHFFSDYFVLLDVREENKRMQRELDRIEMENQYLRTELDTAERAKALSIFQASSPSKTIAAHVISNGTDSGGKLVIVDLGSLSGVQKGMAVIEPSGIVGKVVQVFPTASFVLLVTDPTFAAGVISGKNRVRGTLKGQGHSTVMVDYVQNEEKLDQGEWFYTSGDDRIFPKGLPVGEATVVRAGKSLKEIYVTPSGFQNGLEEVLIVIQGVHGSIPETPAANQPVHLMDPPPPEPGDSVAAAPRTGPGSDADRLLDQYRRIGESQKHVYGERGTGAPNYNAPVDLNPKPDAGAKPATDTAPKTAPETPLKKPQ